MKARIYINGSLVRREEAKISAFDYGLLYGYGLFETMRAYSGKIFRLKEHLRRLFKSAQTIGISIGQTKDEIKEAIDQTLKANNLLDAYIRLTLTYGEGLPRLQFAEETKPNLIIFAQELPDNLIQRQEKGIRAIIAKTRQNNLSPLTSVKSLNFLNHILARLEARSKGAEESILLNCSGYVCEASTANIFLVSGDKLITPSIESGILPGITRHAILEIAPKLGLKTREKSVTIYQLLKAQEVFLTNSIIELLPVIEIDGKPIGHGEAGQVTKRLQQAYKELVQGEIKEVFEPSRACSEPGLSPDQACSGTGAKC